ncbi:hypothetical protein TI39_contig4232g00006 [Zymoseptoria brevis]|uniref:Uncharacterized protein n=1 Tax=Zymoseptoria brevis TaxID=1047168 RepID=A0A0F4GAC1_9PEZI|nr:hypothetical protein TI39_contig4232g00006 [Zymoseptoria brevis]
MASAGQIFFASGGGCDGTGSVQNPGSGGVTCRQLGGIGSAKAQSVDDGCSFTVYTDSNCSNNPTAAGLGQCISGTMNSYSYDC